MLPSKCVHMLIEIGHVLLSFSLTRTNNHDLTQICVDVVIHEMDQTLVWFVVESFNCADPFSC